MGILLFLGGLVLFGVIMFIICRTFWLRTIMVLLLSVLAILMMLSGDGVVSSVFCGIAIFFLGGSLFGQKTGNVEWVKKQTLTGTKYTPVEETHTLGLIGMSIAGGIV